MYQAQWNEKKWQISDNEIKSIENLSFSYRQKAKKNDAAEEVPLTNENGFEPFAVRFETILHSGMGIDIRNEIASWKELVSKTDILYINGQPIDEKMLQLTSLNVSDLKIDNFGRWIYATLSFTFVENSDVPIKDDSIEIKPSAQNVKPTEMQKESLKTEMPEIQNAEIQTVQVGSYVMSANYPYPLKVSRIQGDNVYLSSGGNRTEMVKINEVSLT